MLGTYSSSLTNHWSSMHGHSDAIFQILAKSAIITFDLKARQITREGRGLVILLPEPDALSSTWIMRNISMVSSENFS